MATGAFFLLPAAIAPDDAIFAPSAVPGAVTVYPAQVADPDAVYAGSILGAGTVLLPQLVMDGDDIPASALTYLPILRPVSFSDADLFYSASLVGGIPVPKHPLTGSLGRPFRKGTLASQSAIERTIAAKRLTGRVGSRPQLGGSTTAAKQLTGTLKKVA